MLIPLVYNGMRGPLYNIFISMKMFDRLHSPSMPCCYSYKQEDRRQATNYE